MNTRAAGVDQADDRRAVAHGQIHHAADFVALHFAERAAVDGEILRVDVHRAPVDLAVARHDAFAHVGFGGEAGFVVALVGDERFQLVKRAGVEQHIQAFAGGEFTFGVLRGDPFIAAAGSRALADAPQFENTGVFLGHIDYILNKNIIKVGAYRNTPLHTKSI